MIIIFVIDYRCKSLERKGCHFEVTKLVTTAILISKLDPERMILIITQQWPPFLFEKQPSCRSGGTEKTGKLCCMLLLSSTAFLSQAFLELHLPENGTRNLTRQFNYKSLLYRWGCWLEPWPTKTGTCCTWRSITRRWLLRAFFCLYYPRFLCVEDGMLIQSIKELTGSWDNWNLLILRLADHSHS